MKPNELIIIGGGASIKEGIEKGLWNKIDRRFNFGLNYSYKYFKSTVQIYVDDKFYEKQRLELVKLPLIIGKTHQMHVESNTITLSTGTQYFRNLSNGVYSPDLCGLFALSLGIYILDKGTIYLLGYDFGELRKKNLEEPVTDPKTFEENTERDKRKRLITHFYQGDFEHRGVGKTSYYHSKNRVRSKFKVYKNEKKIKIYNVSPNSRIPSDLIEKINYNTFFKKLNNTGHDQSELRKFIRKKLNA